MRDNPKLFLHDDLTCYSEDGDEMKRPGWISTELTLWDLHVMTAPEMPDGAMRSTDALKNRIEWRCDYADAMLAERKKRLT